MPLVPGAGIVNLTFMRVALALTVIIPQSVFSGASFSAYPNEPVPNQ